MFDYAKYTKLVEETDKQLELLREELAKIHPDELDVKKIARYYDLVFHDEKLDHSAVLILNRSYCTFMEKETLRTFCTKFVPYAEVFRNYKSCGGLTLEEQKEYDDIPCDVCGYNSDEDYQRATELRYKQALAKLPKELHSDFIRFANRAADDYYINTIYLYLINIDQFDRVYEASREL